MINLKETTEKKQWKTYNILQDTEKYRLALCSDTKVLCFFPPKSLPNHEFLAKHENKNDFIVKECIKGKKIQLFYDDRIKSWVTISPTNVTDLTKDAERFFQALKKDDENIFTLNDIPLVKRLPKARSDCVSPKARSVSPKARSDCVSPKASSKNQYCYTFIMKNDKQIYLTAVYEIYEYDWKNHIKYLSPFFFETWSELSGWQFPATFSSIESAETDCVVIEPASGEQTVIYKTLQTQITPSNVLKPFFYQFLVFDYCEKIEEYLRFFPLYREPFKEYKKICDDVVKKIHRCYVDYFITKKKASIPEKYSKHVWHLHREFYQPKLIKVTFLIVSKYWKSLLPGEKMETVLYTEC
jgi:hypothetical protein